MSQFHRHHLIGITLLVVLGAVREVRADDRLAVATGLYQSGRWQQAAAAFDRLAADSQLAAATLLKARLYAGECLVQLGRYAEARQRYQFVQQHQLAQQEGGPANFAAQAQFRLGEAAWLAGDAVEATRLLQTYVERHPLDGSVSYAQAYLAKIREQKLLAEDFAVLDQAVGWERDARHDAALAAYHGLLQRQLSGPVRAETLRRAAQLHDRLSQSREALKYYHMYLAEYPASRRTAEIRLAVAWLHHRLDHFSQAEEQFRLVHAKFPQSAQAVDAAYWLALANVDRTDAAAAPAAAGGAQATAHAVNVGDVKVSGPAAPYVDWLLAQERLPTERPQLWGQTLCLKCQLFSAAGQWPEIEELVEAAQERLPVGPLKTKLDFWAAEAAFRRRRYDTASRRFKAVQPRTIGINEPWTTMVPLRRSQLAARRQQWSEVLKRLDQLERDFPEFELDYEIDYLRGRALAGRGEMSAARKYYRRVLDNPSAGDTEAAMMAGWMIGETFFHQQDYARARRAYQNVMEQAALPEWQSRAALQAGKCWELEQRWDKAADVYNVALSDGRHPTPIRNWQRDSAGPNARPGRSDDEHDVGTNDEGNQNDE